MKLAAIVVAVVLLTCVCGGGAQASWLSEIIMPVTDFATETLTAPDDAGVVAGDPFTIAFAKAWEVGNVPGLSLLDMYGGLTLSPEAPVLGGIVTVEITNVKGTKLCLGIKTNASDEARWVLDAGVLQMGFDPIFAIQHAI